MNGYYARIRWEHRDRMTAAWHGAAIGRAKKVPSLAEMLGEQPEKPQQTADQMLAIMQSLVGRKG